MRQLLFDGIDTPDLNTLRVYRERGGYEMLARALEWGPERVLEELQASGVRGRGGAGFAMGKKASFIPHGTMEKYVVCNADESEPGTFKDRELMQKNPHLLIEGLAIASLAIEATRAFIFIRGEETALLDSLEGKRGNPRLKPPFPAVQGLYQGPTLVNNVETLMNAPIILRMGGAEYAKIGTETSTGTKVVSVSGCVQRPGNYEIELGIPTRQIIFDLAGGPPPGREVKFFFPGGSSAPVLPGTDEYLDLPYDFDSMQKAGSMLGSGAIIVVDDSVPVIDVALKTAKFYKHESCGKCTPCREGTNWTVKMLERIQNGLATPMDLDIMASVQDQIMGNCLCVLGDAMAMPISSMINHFRDEFEAWMERAREDAGLGAAMHPQHAHADYAGPYPPRTRADGSAVTA